MVQIGVRHGDGAGAQSKAVTQQLVVCRVAEHTGSQVVVLRAQLVTLQGELAGQRAPDTSVPAQ